MKGLHRCLVRDLMDTNVFPIWRESEDEDEFVDRLLEHMEGRGYGGRDTYPKDLFQRVYGDIGTLYAVFCFMENYPEQVDATNNWGPYEGLPYSELSKALARSLYEGIVINAMKEIYRDGKNGGVSPSLNWTYPVGRPLAVDIGEDDWEEVELEEGDGWSINGEVTRSDFRVYLDKKFEEYN